MCVRHSRSRILSPDRPHPSWLGRKKFHTAQKTRGYRLHPAPHWFSKCVTMEKRAVGPTPALVL